MKRRQTAGEWRSGFRNRPDSLLHGTGNNGRDTMWKKKTDMNGILKAVLTALIVVVCTISHAGSYNGADGGNGTKQGKPGCDGGTNPSPDGKFYIPGTDTECNPGENDRKKPGQNFDAKHERGHALLPRVKTARWLEPLTCALPVDYRQDRSLYSAAGATMPIGRLPTKRIAALA